MHGVSSACSLLPLCYNSQGEAESIGLLIDSALRLLSLPLGPWFLTILCCGTMKERSRCFLLCFPVACSPCTPQRKERRTNGVAC